MRKPKKVFVVSLIIIVIIAIVAVSLMFFYANTVSEILDEENTTYLQEVAQQEASIIETQVNGDLATLQSIAMVFGSEYTPSLLSDEAMEILKTLQKQNQFKRMGIIYPNGSAFTTDGGQYDFSNREYFKKALAEIPNISDTFFDAVDGGNINVYAVPVYNGAKVECVLFATNETNLFENKISVSTFGGRGYSYVVDQAGNKIAASHHEDSITFDNIFNLQGNVVEDPDGNFAVMQENMKKGESGVVRYLKHGEPYYISYAPIGVNTWYVVSAVPASVATAKSSYLITLTGWMTGIIACTVVIFLVYIVLSQNRSRRSLERVVYEDELTGSLSWMKFREEAKNILREHPGHSFAMINFDVNKFKIFNQLYDYQSGNMLLRHIAFVLKKDMRENELYTHTGSDDFDVLIEYSSDEDIIGRILKWNQQIRDYSFARKRKYNLLLSYGIYKIQENDTYITRMNDRSKIAKNSVKNNAHTFYAFYDDMMNHEMLREKELENDMETALLNREFEVYYQPKFDLETQKPIAVEALVRWKSPKKGFMSPGAFIPVFERNGFITKLDLYVFEETCAALRRWSELGRAQIPVSVNFSRLNMYDDNFVQSLKDIVQKYNISTDLLEIELTESALAYNDELIIRRMNELREAGFCLSIDDFGTGYSSLNLLRTLPVNVIKLDKRFFTLKFDSERERVIITSIVGMAQQLGITVVAEGVETKAQADFLKGIGKSIIVQGFLYARPMSEEDLLRWLSEVE
ncbi:bifunctional diguanylate cyclase/phosphodiesterase [Christensenella intestinihominis]|uniref:bifunctional diguanylate cyclase/phosphodiesterase n=1 Tax=Christensenella intestinihominis TaxID=1851429 RepID=UPI0008351FB4|nr:EAL domain-containing protein [Christensenella intestinihominis]